MTALNLPPLFYGKAVPTGADPFHKAQAEAARGCDAGLVAYHFGADTLSAAIVFAPEVALEDAMAMLPLCGVGFQNALGALAPPELALHLQWDGGLRLNGAACGRLKAAASHTMPSAEPDWLVIGLVLPLWPEDEETGHRPDETALYAEGCADVQPASLLESWTRHTLAGIHIWLDEGNAPLHRQWQALAYGLGEAVTVAGYSGTFIGIDENFSMLLQQNETTRLIPLTTLLETQPS